MKAYYFDNAEGDQRLPHFDENRPPVDVNTLEKIHVKYRSIPIDKDGNWEQVGGSPVREADGLNRVAKGDRSGRQGMVLQKSRRDQLLEGWSRRCLRVKNQNLLRGVSLRANSSLS